jgi:CRISPR system Cascade subunit CasA
MRKFNLIDEPWIPIRFIDGGRVSLGLKSVFREAQSIAEIEDTSPLVVAALHRLLLAILYRALAGPTDFDQAKTLFKEGWPVQRIEEYLESWRDRFWLFDDKYPFWQVAEFQSANLRAWTALAAEHNGDSSKILFDHTDIRAAGRISAAAAARWMLATQAFVLSSANSPLGYTADAPCASAILVLPQGRNIRETLSYLLVPENREVLTADLPIWEREPDSVVDISNGLRRPPTGVCDLYTWRSRTVRLANIHAPEVQDVAFAAGVRMLKDGVVDPMVAYDFNEKNGRFELQFRDRGVWRDFDALLPDGEGLAPLVISNAVRLSRYVPDRTPIAILVLGQKRSLSAKAKIEYWRLERFSFPQSLRDDKSIKGKIKSLLREAVNTEKALKKACDDFVFQKLSHETALSERDMNEKKQKMKRSISQSSGQLLVVPTFWSILEVRFQELLHLFTPEFDYEKIRAEWLASIRRAMLDAWGLHRRTVSTGDAWGIRALVRAERHIARTLAMFEREIGKLEVSETQYDRVYLST